MGKSGKKPKFTVDENIFVEDFKKLYSKKAKFLSVYDLTKRFNSVDDKEILQSSVKINSHIVTRNFRHFNEIKKKDPRYNKCAIVGIGGNIKEFIPKFGELLRENPYHEDYKDFILIDNSGIKQKAPKKTNKKLPQNVT